MQFLGSNKLLSISQHGFRPKLSTETALTYVTDKIYQNMDSKKVTVLTLCDLSKAFDSVSHQILLRKCSDLNIDNFWLNNYLQNRTQSVRLNNILYDEMNITCGAPQGSILGPVLFSIYVNDISKYLEQCNIIQYADDTQFFHSGPVHKFQEVICKTKKTLHDLKHYFLRNGSMLNAKKKKKKKKKTQCIYIGSRKLLSRIPSNTFLNFDSDHILYPSTRVKNLGLYVHRQVHAFLCTYR